MNQRQIIALANPCARSDDTLAGEFYRSVRVGSVTLSTMLTVNK